MAGRAFCVTNLELDNFPHPLPPPSYEQCVAPVKTTRADDFTVTPLAVIALLDWYDEEDW
jgi:hypothetical protein